MHASILTRWRTQPGVLLAASILILVPACGAPTPTTPGSSEPAATWTAEEYVAAVVRCLREAGWEVQIDGSGDSFSAPSLTDAQRPAFIDAKAACDETVGLPPPPESLSESQIRQRYQFLLDARTCLIGLGYAISEPPSEDAFVESWSTGPWSPHNEIVDIVSQQEWDEVNTECPQS